MNQEENRYFSINIEEKNNKPDDNNIITLNNLEDNEFMNWYDEIGTSESQSTSIQECCNSKQLVQDINSNLTCINCGSVANDELDRTFSTNNSNADIVSNSSNYNCPINYFFKESSMGTRIGGRGNSRMKTIHKWTFMPYKERSRRDVFNFISGICKKSNISKAIIDNAHILYTNLSMVKHHNGKNIIIRGNNRESLIAACVYFGCKIQGQPRRPKFIAKMFGLGLTDVTSGCRKFLEIMGEDVAMYRITSSKASDYVRNAGKQLRLQEKYIKQTIKIVKNMIKLDYASDHQPPSIAASCLLFVVNLNNLDIDRDKISKVFDISTVTIDRIYEKIDRYAAAIMNDESVERIYKQIQMKKKGIETEDTISYSETSLFTTKQDMQLSEMNLITTSPDEISITPKAIETDTDTETMIKPGKPKRKYTRRKKKQTPSI